MNDIFCKIYVKYVEIWNNAYYLLAYHIFRYFGMVWAANWWWKWYDSIYLYSLSILCFILESYDQMNAHDSVHTHPLFHSLSIHNVSNTRIENYYANWTEPIEQ